MTGRLWLRAAAVDFPEPGWFDCPVPVLAWWLKSLANAAENGAATCRFMDGPHEFTLRGASATAAGGERHCVLRTSDGDAWAIAGAEFAASLRAAAAATLAECDRRGWASRDILELRHAVRRAGHHRAG